MRGKCSAVIHLARNTHEFQKETEHAHGSNWGRCKATEVISALKDEQGTSDYTTASLSNRHTSSASIETYRKVPKNESMERTVQRVKQGNLPSNSKSLTDVTDIPDIFKIDKDGEHWLSVEIINW
ncbi:hypothetical protein C0J52_15071 [Blattella germanica]|nr:hypothetical protein C0J52_15071 [Blattella germanica]